MRIIFSLMKAHPNKQMLQIKARELLMYMYARFPVQGPNAGAQKEINAGAFI